jgi:GAF domain-containing protein
MTQQAIEHLDPNRRGMAISLVRCVAPLKGGKVRSLREVGGIGTPPWERDLRQHTIFLGAESLCGLAVTRSRLAVVHDRQANHELIPAHWVTHEQSAAAYPLLHQSRVIECLLLSGAHPHQITATHTNVMQAYANLLALAFSQRTSST